jgi:hypothetical protein
MASLGTFGAAVREREPNAEPDTFEFCGETFTVHGTIPSMLHLTIAAAWAGKVSAFEGDAALFEALRHALTVPRSTPAAEGSGRRIRSGTASTGWPSTRRRGGVAHRSGLQPDGRGGWPPYRATIHLLHWIVADFAEFEQLILGLPGLAGLTPGRRGLGWLDHVSPRLLVNIAWQHLRGPLRHAQDCEQRVRPAARSANSTRPSHRRCCRRRSPRSSAARSSSGRSRTDSTRSASANSSGRWAA